MNLFEKSAGDNASVSSTVSDEGYAEFLRFLTSPSPVETKKVEPIVDAHDKEEPAVISEDDSQDSLPESLPDGPRVFIGDAVAPPEDSLVATAQYDEEASASFYVGPGEMGFTQGGSIHDSDISDTDSDAIKDNDSDDESVESSEMDADSVDEPLVDRNAEVKLDDVSVSSDEGYNEFLQFLMSPSVAISIQDNGSVTLSVSLKDKELGSVTLSVKEEASVVPSVDAGYEEFLLFLQSPEPVKKIDSLDAVKGGSTSTNLNTLVDESRSLSFEHMEKAKYEGTSGDPNLTEITKAVAVVEKGEIWSDSSPRQDRVEIKEHGPAELVEVAPAECPSLEVSEVSEIEDTAPKKLITAAAIGSAVAAKPKNKVISSEHGEDKAVKSITTEETRKRPASSVPSSKLASEDTLTAEFASAAAVGTIAAAVLISSEEDKEVRPVINMEAETIEDRKCSSPAPVIELKCHDTESEGFIKAAAATGVVTKESGETAADEPTHTTTTGEHLSPNPYRAEVNNNRAFSPLSAISHIYFADTKLREEDVAISKIYFVGAELGEDDVIESPVPKLTESNEDNTKSPAPSEGTYSDLDEEESLNSLNSSEFPENQEELSKPQSPLAILGKVEVNKEVLQSLSSAGSFDEFFECISQGSNHSAIIDKIPVGMGLANNMSIKCGSPVMSLEDFYDCVSQMSLKTTQSESERSQLSRHESSEYIIKTFLLSLVFHLVQFKLESGVAEIAIWGHLYMRFMRSAK